MDDFKKTIKMLENLDIKTKECRDFEIRVTKGTTEVKGCMPELLTGLSCLVASYVENDIPKEFIRFAVELGLNAKRY